MARVTATPYAQTVAVSPSGVDSAPEASSEPRAPKTVQGAGTMVPGSTPTRRSSCQSARVTTTPTPP